MSEFKPKYDREFEKVNDKAVMKIVIMVLVAGIYFYMFLKVIILP